MTQTTKKDKFAEKEIDFTRVPDIFFKQIPLISTAEMKIYLILCAATNIEPKQWRWLKRSYFVKATKLTAKSVTSGITGLIAKDLIEQRPNANSFDYRVKHRKFIQNQVVENKEKTDVYPEKEVITTPRNGVIATPSSFYPTNIYLSLNEITNILNEQQQRLFCCCSLVSSSKVCDENELEHLRKQKTRNGFKYKSVFCQPTVTVFLIGEIQKLKNNSFDNPIGYVKTLQQTGGRDREIREFSIEIIGKYGIENFRANLEDAQENLKEVIEKKASNLSNPKLSRDRAKIYEDALKAVTPMTKTNV